MSDSGKTKQQLIDELNALRAKMDPAAGKSTAEAEGAAGGQSKGQTTGLTRRDVLTAWVAPVILTVALMPRMAAAGVPPPPTPSPVPTQIPATLSPTPAPAPTVSPTPRPSPAPAPTLSPTAFPTVTPTAVIPVELSEFKID